MPGDQDDKGCFARAEAVTNNDTAFLLAEFKNKEANYKARIQELERDLNYEKRYSVRVDHLIETLRNVAMNQ